MVKRKDKFDDTRSFVLHSKLDNQKPQEERVFPTNFIKTSQYNIVNFLPKALLLQFERYANIYFLIIAILQTISIISPLSPWSAIAPLVFVLAVSMTRQGFEDVARHKSDAELNSMPSQKLQDNKEASISWADIEVGDLIVVREDEPFPADLIVISTSYPNGVCYIETGALDGEQNLKPQGALAETMNFFSGEEDKDDPNITRIKSERDLKVELKAEKPNMELYRFEGSFIIEGKQTLISAKQLLLRGAYLRNTPWIVGATVYSGLDTKIMRNAESGRNQQSDVEHIMNKYILYILATQLSLALITCLIGLAWGIQNQTTTDINRHLYIQEEYEPGVNAIIKFFSYFLLYNTMIPISLIVSMEMVKVAQSYFITTDQEMYVAHNDKWPKVSTTTINEELGQVEYVFSDKTGTLTCNVMQFKMSIIGDKLYGKEEADRLENQRKNEDQAAGPKKEHSMTEFVFKDKNMDQLLSPSAEGNFDVNLVLQSLDGQATYQIKDQKALAHEYWTLLGAAHECIVQKIDKKLPQTDLNNIKYQGPSPDEITLVDAAQNMNFAFVGASESTVDMLIQDKPEKIELHNSFQFDSARKRMSVIIKHNGVYKMLIKGADNIIKSRLSNKIPQPYLANTVELLSDFSKIGLRTLMMAMKILSEDEVMAFKEQKNKLADSKDREKELNQIADSIEKELLLIGATAVEDKLQDQVPEVIADLLRASDKLETAENIAKSCRLIQDDMRLIVVQTKTKEELDVEMKSALNKKIEIMNEKKRKAFLVEGEALAVIFPDKELKEIFIEISKDCESVVCCRVTPKQKAEVVRTIKDGLKKICLAIGDGANDVNMIQEAQIGCGIYGNEGMRAVQSADFAFGEFRCLWRLLLIHGRWSYIRISQMIVYFFYKNMIFTIPQFYFAFYSAFSGQSVFDDWYVTLYNLFFTALPLIVKAVFDQDVNYKLAGPNAYQVLSEKPDINLDPELDDLLRQKEYYLRRKVPELYGVGQKKTLFTTMNFLSWLVQGVVHGAILYWGVLFTFDQEILYQDGYNSGLWDFSITMYSIVVFLADLKLTIHTRYWTVFNFAAMWLTSILLYLLFVIISNYMESSQAYSITMELLRTSYFYLNIVLVLGLIFAFDIAVFNLQKLDFKKHKEELFRVLMKFIPKDNQNPIIPHKDQLRSFNNLDLKNGGGGGPQPQAEEPMDNKSQDKGQQ